MVVLSVSQKRDNGEDPSLHRVLVVDGVHVVLPVSS